jgi:endonuclease YncB( thermonuclease family)
VRVRRRQSRWSRLSVTAALLVAAAFVLVPLIYGPSSPDHPGLSIPGASGNGDNDGGSADAPPRAIAPAKFATPFAQNAVHLERIAPRAPLTPVVARETGPRPTLLHKPVVVAAGELAFHEGSLRLKGLVVTEPDEICSAADGSLWPCGIIARTAFRNFIGGRSLSCVLPDGEWSENLVVSCLVGKEDPAAWLVSRGWAQAFFGSNYSDLQRIAQEEGRGIYGSDPRGIAAIPDSDVDIESDNLTPVSDPLPVPLR